MDGFFKAIMHGWHSVAAPFILRRWKGRQEVDRDGKYKVQRAYELVGGGICADLYWYVHDTRRLSDHSRHHKPITVYDRVPINRISEGIRRVETGELREAINEMLKPDDG